MRASSLPEKVADYARRYDMLPRGASVLVGVSGGADSMCLLHILSCVSKTENIRLTAAHMDHKLRGDASVNDRRFVEGYCGANGIPLITGEEDVAAFAKTKKLGIEEAGRIKRYAFFDASAALCGAEKIATAHTASDNAETVILNLIRGAGARGLCGIPPVRGRLIRPLLCASREAIIAYLSENNIPHIEDLSNESDEYTRNRVRRHIIPELLNINPRFVETISAHTELISRDETLLEEQADRFLAEHLCEGKIQVERLLEAPLPIVSRALRKISGQGLYEKHISSVLALCAGNKPSGTVRLHGKICRREYDALLFRDAEEDAKALEPFILRMGETAEIPGLGMTVFCKKAEFNNKINKSFNTFLFAKDKLCGNIVVRSRMTGDRISLIGRNGGKTLKKLFIDEKIPSVHRDSIPVLADDGGPIAIYGFGQDVRTAPGLFDECVAVIFEKTKG